jgi:hypothetical protein
VHSSPQVQVTKLDFGDAQLQIWRRTIALTTDSVDTPDTQKHTRVITFQINREIKKLAPMVADCSKIIFYFFLF